MTTNRKALIAEARAAAIAWQDPQAAGTRSHRIARVVLDRCADALEDADAEIERLMRNGAEIAGAKFALLIDYHDAEAEIERLRAALKEIAGGHVEGRPGIPNDAWFQIVARAALTEDM